MLFRSSAAFWYCPARSSAPIIAATMDIYKASMQNLLPTPSKSHYTFNLRDLSKVVQGMLMVFKKDLTEEKYLLKLWLHESARVFRDRLINDEDRKWFLDRVKDAVQEHFKLGYSKVVPAADESKTTAPARLPPPL